MINKQRVQRIKNLIYAFIVLLLLLPLILMSILSFQMFGAIKDLNTKVDNLSKSAAFQTTGQSPADIDAPDDSVLEPQTQSSKPADTENPADSHENALRSGENPADSPEDASFDVNVQGEATSPPADGGNELGGGAPIEDGAPVEAESGEYLGAATDSENRSTEAEKELATNPQMGYGDDAPSPDHTLNPSTGS